MRALAVINSLGAGGAERSLVESIQPLRERGIDIDIATVCPDPQDGFLAQAQSVSTVYGLAGSRLSTLGSLRRLITSRNYALIHTTLFDADVIGRLATRRSVPLLTSLVNTSYDPVRLHDPRVSSSRLAAARILDASTGALLTNHYHAISKAVALSAIEHLRIPASRITVVPRARSLRDLGEPSASRRSSMRAHLRIPESTPLIVSIGREEFQKGHVLLLEAMANVVRNMPSARLVMAGREGNASESIEQAIASLQLEGVVRRLGHIQTVPDLLVAADVLAFPSLFEGLGGTLLEALALGTPIVASNLPVIEETCGDAAVLVEPRQAEEFSASLTRLLEDPLKRRRLATAGQTLFHQRYDMETVMDRMADLMRSVAGGS